MTTGEIYFRPFLKVRNVLGGHIHDMVSGSAPISSDVVDFLKIAFSCEIYEGTMDIQTCNEYLILIFSRVIISTNAL